MGCQQERRGENTGEQPAMRWPIQKSRAQTSAPYVTLTRA